MADSNAKVQDGGTSPEEQPPPPKPAVNRQKVSDAPTETEAATPAETPGVTHGGDEESSLPEKRQPVASENDPWQLDRLKALCKSDIAAFALHELAIWSANPSLVGGDGRQHAVEGAFRRFNMELRSSSLVDSLSTLTDAKRRSAQQNTATARKEFFASQLVQPQQDELLVDFLPYVRRINEGERLRPTSASSGVAVPPEIPVEALPPPPVYFYGIIPKGREGKPYLEEIMEEISKPHWLELMNQAQTIILKQTQQQGRRRVNLRKAALTVVEGEMRKSRQFIYKDYDESSPNKRKETVLDADSATKYFHENIKTLRKRPAKKRKTVSSSLVLAGNGASSLD